MKKENTPLNLIMPISLIIKYNDTGQPDILINSIADSNSSEHRKKKRGAICKREAIRRWLRLERKVPLTV